MKVLGINSSPRSEDQSKTEMMLTHLVDGMREAGAAVEVITLREKKIRSCTGCFTCWTKTPGRCIHQDDMTKEVYPKWLEADLAIYASPLYYHTMNGVMSMFRERTLPAVQPFLEMGEDGLTFHPLRHKLPDAVWLSVCGFPELAEFDALSDFLNRTHHQGVEIIAEIYRPCAEMMDAIFLKEITDDIIDATEQAGRELVISMKVSEETMARIRQPLLSPEQFAKVGNGFWNSCLAAGVTPKKFREDKMVPRPDSLDTFRLYFPAGINSKAIDDRTAKLQFKFDGQIDGSCFFTIESGKVTSEIGVCKTPDITIESSFELWMDIMTKKVDGQQMFMEQKYTVEGDIEFMIELFKPENE